MYEYFASVYVDEIFRNAWAMEQLLIASTSIGTTLTLFQMAFVACQGLMNIVVKQKSFPYIAFKPRTVPLHRWTFQVLAFWTSSVLNNMALGYSVPVSLMIVFRSGGKKSLLCKNTDDHAAQVWACPCYLGTLGLNAIIIKDKS